MATETKSFSNAAEANVVLQEAAAKCHLVAPAQTCTFIPEGCVIAITWLRISAGDPKLYAVGDDKLGLGDEHFELLAREAGVSTVDSRRTDDGRHPHYVCWQTEVAYRQWDASMVRRRGTVELDARAPSGAEFLAIMAGDNADREIEEFRRYILRTAETRALKRAVAQLGIEQAYTRGELRKSFAVARLLFTGASTDPDARRQYRESLQQSFLGSTTQLYGPPPSSRRGPMSEGYSSGEFKDDGEVA
jgi:hypothetical protein